MRSLSIEHEGQDKADPRLLAVVEITRTAAESLRDLLFATYYASQGGVIALLLRDITPAEVDVILDAVVCKLPRDIPGVIYIDAGETLMARLCIGRATRLFLLSDDLRSFADGQRPLAEPSPSGMLELASSQAGHSRPCLNGYSPGQAGYVLSPSINPAAGPALCPLPHPTDSDADVRLGNSRTLPVQGEAAGKESAHL